MINLQVLDVMESDEVRILILFYILLTVNDGNSRVFISLIIEAISEFVFWLIHCITTDISFLITIKADELLWHHIILLLHFSIFSIIFDIETPVEQLGYSPEAIVMIEEHLGVVILVVVNVV